MHLNLNDHHSKTSRYSYRSTYVNYIVTTNQKPTIDIQNLETKEHKHNTKKIIKPQGNTKRRRKELRRTTETNNKMTLSTYLSIITLNVNGLNAPIKRHG